MNCNTSKLLPNIAPVPEIQKGSLQFIGLMRVVKDDIFLVRRDWNQCGASDGRDGVFFYLTSVYEAVQKWKRWGRAQEFAKRALETRKVSPKLQLEPYSVLIYCTTHQQLDRRMRSKYSRLIRCAERLGVEPRDFTGVIKRLGGMNNALAVWGDMRCQ